MFPKFEIVVVLIIIAIYRIHVQAANSGDKRKIPESSSGTALISCNYDKEVTDNLVTDYLDERETSDKNYTRPHISGIKLRKGLVAGPGGFLYNVNSENAKAESEIPETQVKLNMSLTVIGPNPEVKRLGDPIEVTARNLKLNYGGNEHLNSIYAIRPPYSYDAEDRKSSAAILYCNRKIPPECNVYCYAEDIPIN